MLFALDICVNKKAPPTHSVHWGLNPPPAHLKNITPSFFLFCQAPYLICKLSKPHFLRRFTPPPPKKKKLEFFSELP